MNNKAYLNRLFESDKPLIIYKATDGFDVYTDFSHKVKIQKSNLKNFLKKTTILGKKRNKFFLFRYRVNLIKQIKKIYD